MRRPSRAFPPLPEEDDVARAAGEPGAPRVASRATGTGARRRLDASARGGTASAPAAGRETGRGRQRSRPTGLARRAFEPVPPDPQRDLGATTAAAGAGPAVRPRWTATLTGSHREQHGPGGGIAELRIASVPAPAGVRLAPIAHNEVVRRPGYDRQHDALIRPGTATATAALGAWRA